VASAGFGLSALSAGASRRPHPRWEPDAVVPLVRICGGGRERSWSLLRLYLENNIPGLIFHCASENTGKKPSDMGTSEKTNEGSMTACQAMAKTWLALELH
jgi:hypothetical protein